MPDKKSARQWINIYKSKEAECGYSCWRDRETQSPKNRPVVAETFRGSGGVMFEDFVDRTHSVRDESRVYHAKPTLPAKTSGNHPIILTVGHCKVPQDVVL
jgi:hypothetical protein